MRTDLACTERVTIWPRSSPETFLKLPIFAMMCVTFTSGPRQSRPRCAGRAGRQTAPQPKARSEAEDGSDQTFLVRGERRNAGGRKSGQSRCGKKIGRAHV